MANSHKALNDLYDFDLLLKVTAKWFQKGTDLRDMHAKYSQITSDIRGLVQGFQSADSIHAINLLTSCLFTVNTMWTN